MLTLLIKAIYEWFSFASEAVSALGLFKRAAAATTSVAAAAPPRVPVPFRFGRVSSRVGLMDAHTTASPWRASSPNGALQRDSASLYWLFAAALFICMGIANAAGNFVLVRLPKGVTVELPKNWTVLTNNQRITLDLLAQTMLDARGIAYATSDLAFAATYYDDQGETAGIFYIRYYPLDVTQSKARAANAADVKELDAALRQTVVPVLEMAGGRLLAWIGTTKQSINGATAFVTEYRHSSLEEGSFRVRLVRFFNAQKSFTITISYREDQEYFLRPICDRIINSIRI